MTLSGSLEDVPVVDIMQFIHLGRRSGTLSLRRDEEQAQLGFHRGQIVSARGPARARLGDVLVTTGVIEEAALEEALQVQAREHPHRSIGQILVSSGVIEAGRLRAIVERRIEETVCTLVAWHHGQFHFALDDVTVIDDAAVCLSDILPDMALDTEMVLMEALRIFDERNRDGAPTDGAGAAPAATPTAAPEAPLPELAAGSGLVPFPTEPRPRVQVVTHDQQLVERLAIALAAAAPCVVRTSLRDAGSPPPGEPPPIVLLDLRQGAAALDAVATLRRARPRASVLAVVEPCLPAARVYAVGALAALPPDVATIAACCESVIASRRDTSSEAAIAAGMRAGFAKLRRVLADLRSGMLSATMSLNLMSIVAESLERAVLFLCRRRDLVALGAFGQAVDGRGLAEATRGLRLELDSSGILTDSLNDGHARTVPWDRARLPAALVGLVGCPATGQVAAFPVLGGKHMVAVIYADNGRSNRAIDEVEILELATAQVGLAFENELLRRKGRTTTAEAAG